jgi:hypothetical protein
VLARELNHVLDGAWQQAQATLQLLLATAIVFVLKRAESRNLLEVAVRMSMWLRSK